MEINKIVSKYKMSSVVYRLSIRFEYYLLEDIGYEKCIIWQYMFIIYHTKKNKILIIILL